MLMEVGGSDYKVLFFEFCPALRYSYCVAGFKFTVTGAGFMINLNFSYKKFENKLKKKKILRCQKCFSFNLCNVLRIIPGSVDGEQLKQRMPIEFMHLPGTFLESAQVFAILVVELSLSLIGILITYRCKGVGFKFCTSREIFNDQPYFTTVNSSKQLTAEY
uniref:Uncharacterized protein n=1 Tax=Glossina brevipalpis TaxID=37001 RepID=A0A1A9WEV3_9MUSC